MAYIRDDAWGGEVPCLLCDDLRRSSPQEGTVKPERRRRKIYESTRQNETLCPHGPIHNPAMLSGEDYVAGSAGKLK